MNPVEPCPCGENARYAACCGLFLDSGQVPETAEALMRSRYTAYVRGRADYLLRTWHSATQPATLDLESEPVRWLGLKILRVAAGGSEETHGTVEFVARYKVGGQAHRLHEVSRFVRENGQWFYRDAERTG